MKNIFQQKRGEQRRALVMLALSGAKINDERYEFCTETEQGQVVKCVINNAEVKDIPGIDYRLDVNPENPGKIDALQVILNDENKKLSQIFTQLPYGIIKKNVPGIGATTLALNSPNHCVIVCPTKALAYEKYLTGINPETNESRYLYVGSAIGIFHDYIGSYTIERYLADDSIRYKKILVVADSLKKVMECITPQLNKWYIMVDEIDSYQMDSTFRNKALGWVMDYFFQFPERQRCLVSATMRPFSDPKILRMPVIEINFRRLIQREVKLLHTNNTYKSTADAIVGMYKKYGPAHKIAIAYNRITAIQTIIKLLPKELQAQCAILCSPNSEAQAGKYYANLEDNKLPKPITFITCTYFVGIDIDERFHLLSVSDVRQLYTLLPPEKMLQIAGRCRRSEGVYDELIIYSTSTKLNKKYELYDPEMLTELSRDLCAMFNNTLKVHQKYPDVLTGAFISSMALMTRQTKQTYCGSTPVSLVRHNIENVVVPSYFNIDALAEFMRLRGSLYLEYGNLSKEMAKTCRIISDQQAVEMGTDKEREIILTTKAEMNERQSKTVDLAIDFIREMHERGMGEELIPTMMEDMKRQSNRNQRKFVERFEALSFYVPFESLMQTLSDNRDKSDSWYKWYHNAIMFNAMEEGHPFKQVIKGSFHVDENYTSAEIYLKLNAIFEQMGLRPIKDELTAPKWLQSLCTLKRGKNAEVGNYYKVKDYNSEKYLNCKIHQSIEITRSISKIFRF